MGGVPMASRGANAGGAVWALGRVPVGCGVLARARAAEALETREVRAGRGAPARALCGVLARALVGVAGESVMLWAGWIG